MSNVLPDSLPNNDLNAGSALYELWTGPFTGRDLAVVSFRCREAISRAFFLDAFVHVSAHTELLDEPLLGQPATFVVQRPDSSARIFQGVVEAVEPHVASSNKDWTAYRIRIVPRLRLLKWQTTSRIFQGLGVPEIVAAVLGQAAVPVPSSWKLARSYPVRAYCLQHQETDLAFVERLLAEEGIFYYFDHPSDGIEALAAGGAASLSEMMVFIDSADGYPPISATGMAGSSIDGSPELTLRPAESMRAAADDAAQTFAFKRTLRSNSTLLRDYDFRRPLLDLRSEAVVDGADPSAGPPGLRVYSHRGEYDEPEVNAARAQTALDQHRRQASEGAGDSTCRRLDPGHRFTLHSETVPGLSGEYVLIYVDHVGHTPERSPPGTRPYTASFRCVPATVAYRPKRPKPRLRQVLESAVVVGPVGTEIHTDAYGRIKVQFPWDLAGTRNERSSCWIRVMQAWAGSSWGFQFVPRVGMEVMVSFLGGDQDTPIILGCTYNATHPTTFQLPNQQARSGIRTQSTPGANGYNELSFDDSAGNEQVFIHAQRDLSETIEHDHHTEVRRNRIERTVGNHEQEVSGAQAVLVRGDRRVDVQGAQSTTVFGRDATTVRGDESHEIVGDESHTVLSAQSVEVRGSRSVVVGDPSTARQSDHYVYGSASMSATERLVLRAEKGIVLECGTSRIELSPEGIKISATTVDLEAAKGFSAASKEGPSFTLDKAAELVSNEIRLLAKKGALELDDNASLRGEKVKLNCDDRSPTASGGSSLIEMVPFSCKLSDYALAAYAGKTYHLLVEGLKFEGKTDGDGTVKEKIPKDAKQVVLKLWIDDYPLGRQRHYTLSHAELPGADTPLGAQTRLRHLGYSVGVPTDQMNDAARTALSLFQNDHKDSHGLEVNGNLDGATVAALSGVYGA